jgi:ribose transport system permease protein
MASKTGKGGASTSVPLKTASSFDLSLFIARYGTIFALLILVVAFAIGSSNFLTSKNLINVMRQVSVLTVIACGITIAVASGEFDLSLGQIASLSMIVAAGLIVRQEQSTFVAILAAIAAGAVFGIVNGLLVTRARIPSLICTIGTGAIAVGVNYAYAKGDSIYGRIPASFSFIGQGFVGPVPFSVILSLIIWAILYFFLNHTRSGRYIVATGGNPTAARLSGVKISKYRMVGLFLSAVCAAIGGIMLSSYLGAAQPTGGDSYTMNCLAVVFLGMTTIKPGQSNMLGTLIGVLFMGVLNNGLNLVGAPFYAQNIIRGSVLILAVIMAVSREEIRLM